VSDHALFMPIFQSIDSSWTCEQAVGHHLFMEPANIPVEIPGRDLDCAMVWRVADVPRRGSYWCDASPVGNSVLQLYPYYPAKPATVNGVLEKVSDLELIDFSIQNVVSSVSIERVTDQTDSQAIRITLSPCYGLSGWIDAKQIRLELVPGKCSDRVSEW